MARRHGRRDPDAGGATAVPRTAPEHEGPFDRARPLPRERRPDGVRRPLPSGLAARCAEGAARGTRSYLRAMAAHDQARHARHDARVLRTPRLLQERRQMSISVGLDEIKDVADAQAPFAYLLTVSDSASAHAIAITPAFAGDVIVCDAGKSSRANAVARPNVSLLWPPGTPDGYS